MDLPRGRRRYGTDGDPAYISYIFRPLALETVVDAKLRRRKSMNRRYSFSFNRNIAAMVLYEPRVERKPKSTKATTFSREMSRCLYRLRIADQKSLRPSDMSLNQI